MKFLICFTILNPSFLSTIKLTLLENSNSFWDFGNFILLSSDKSLNELKLIIDKFELEDTECYVVQELVGHTFENIQFVYTEGALLNGEILKKLDFEVIQEKINNYGYEKLTKREKDFLTNTYKNGNEY